jgi:hypothetical protein
MASRTHNETILIETCFAGTSVVGEDAVGRRIAAGAVCGGCRAS